MQNPRHSSCCIHVVLCNPIQPRPMSSNTVNLPDLLIRKRWVGGSTPSPGTTASDNNAQSVSVWLLCTKAADRLRRPAMISLAVCFVGSVPDSNAIASANALSKAAMSAMTVRRQGFLDRRPPDLREALAHLVGHSRRRICGVASADVRWSVV